MKYILKFPRGIEVDIYNPPKDFDEQIRKSFEEFTRGTRKEFVYLDKLLYIDVLNEYAHGIRRENTFETVEKEINETIDYYLSEFGEEITEDDFYNIEGLEMFYDLGKSKMSFHGQYEDYADYNRAMELMARAIKVVMNFEYNEVEQ